MGASVLILTGPPGAGKTTAARALADGAPRSAHVESDSFFRSVRSGFVEPWKPEAHAQNQVVMRAVAAAAIEYASAGYFTIVDGIVLPRWFLEPLRSAFADAVLAAYAVLRAPLETCVSRCRDRADGSLADPTVVEGLWRQFADLGERESHAVDVEGLAAGQVVERIAARVRDGSLSL